ncbi:MAG: hypothetical protein NC223_07820 [Butyrivibrio sp.]|nr:hypothetical protein [Butyrivibrio sp.]
MRKKFAFLFCIVLWTALAFIGCAGKNSRKGAPDRVYLYTEKFSAPNNDNFGYYSELKTDGYNAEIYVSEKDGGRGIVIDVDAKFADGSGNSLFLDMRDESFGALLSCGSPAGGTMHKMLYITEDGWSSYEASDISSQIKNYPRHIAMLSDELGYIGGDRRDGSTLYCTLDGGRTWSEADIGVNTRNAFAPIPGGNGKYYELIEIMAAEPSKSAYNLYESDDGLEWERLKTFSLDTGISDYCCADGRICFICNDASVYAMEL